MNGIFWLIFQKQQNSLIAGLRATNEAMMRQEANIAFLGTMQTMATDITSGTSNGSVEKKETSPECQDSLQTDHTKETTPSTSENGLEMKNFH